MKTLRSRLVFAQILPWLLITPLIGLTLYALLETQESLNHLSAELSQQAYQTARLAEGQPEIFKSRSQAELFIEFYYEDNINDPAIRLTLLTPDGEVVGTNLESDFLEGEQQISLIPPAITEIKTTGFLYFQDNLALVMIPVMDLQDQVVGLITASEIVDLSTTQLPLIRNLLIAALVGELILGVIVGLVLANYLGKDLSSLGRALEKISNDSILEALPAHGPQEIRSLIQAYNDAVKRLQEAEKERQSLLANIVHELGRPLGALLAAIQALQRSGNDDAVFREELLAGMVVQIERLQPMLANLTQLYELLPGDLKIELQPTDLNLWLSEVLTPWKAAAQAKGLSWQRDVLISSSSVSIDPDRMAQAVGNILSNAVKYTPEGGQVEVKVLESTDELLISVRDTGPGIDLSEEELIFEPFYRSSHETRFPQGMGLGLSIARDIVHAHGGQIIVESEHGAGSVFTISLPYSAG